MRRILVITAALALLVLPATAQAQQGGGSAADEYTEDVPGAGGNQPSSDDDSGAAAGPSSGGGLPPSVVNDLEAQGADGAGAAKLAQSTGPDKGKGDAKDAAASTNPGDSGGGVGEVLNQLAGGDGESDGGMGVALPIILGVSLLAAVTLLLLRRRGTGPGEPA